MIKKGHSFLMLKISTPTKISFYEEHMKLIKENGFVWFCRFGKSNLVLKSINKYGNLVFVKDSVKNGNKRYLLEFSEISPTPPQTGYPEYYNSVDKYKSLWFKVNSITELDSEIFDSSFHLSSSGGNLSSAYRSMCNSFYITCNKDFNF